MAKTGTEWTKEDRDAFFHRVKITKGMLDALVAQANTHSGEKWIIDFTPTFWFHVQDHTDPAHKRDYGWFDGYEAVEEKMRRLLPTLVLTR